MKCFNLHSRQDSPNDVARWNPIRQIKSLHRQADWLSDAVGKSVKVVTSLIPYLPAEQDYRILFIEGDMLEILASQARMLERHGEIMEDTPARQMRLHQEYGR